VTAPLRRLGTALALAALAVAATALAPRPAGAAGKIAIQLRQVKATEPHGKGPKEFGPGLTELKKELEKFDYRVFNSVGEEKRDVAPGEEVVFRLAEAGFSLHMKAAPTGDHVLIDPLEVQNQKGEKIMSTAIKVRDGGSGIVDKELEDKSGRLYFVFTVKKS
jgi:hypothetical protein